MKTEGYHPQDHHPVVWRTVTTIIMSGLPGNKSGTTARVGISVLHDVVVVVD